MNVSAGTVLMQVKKALKWLPKDPTHRAESLKLLARYFPEEQLKNPSDVKPPKYWWDYMVDKIKKDSPSYTKKQIAATIGDIWYHGLTQAKRNEIIKKAWK
jgi:arabinogalactan endo-1,4-beta-galactosidase